MAIEVPLCYATPSLGMHASHDLKRKLRAIKAAGFAACELGMPDLAAYAGLEDDGGEAREIDTLRVKAKEIGDYCAEIGLKVLVLQPHSQYEGYTGQQHADKLARAERWLLLMGPLRCDMLQVGSNDDRASSGDLAVIALTLRDLCDLCSTYGCRVGYEPWCWGAHVNTWSHCHDVLKRVDRENFGLCLDTFQMAGREWGDPSRPSGRLPTEGYAASLRRLVEQVKPEQIFFFQISDAYKVHITADHADWIEDETPEAREIWSHSYRPLPFDDSRRGYLPIMECVQAVLDTGFRGWFSYEVFLDEMKQEDFDLEAFAKLAISSHQTIMSKVA